MNYSSVALKFIVTTACSLSSYATKNLPKAMKIGCGHPLSDLIFRRKLISVDSIPVITVLKHRGNQCILKVLDIPRGLAERLACSPFTQEVDGSTSTGSTCLNDFSDPIDQDIRTQ